MNPNAHNVIMARAAQDALHAALELVHDMRARAETAEAQRDTLHAMLRRMVALFDGADPDAMAFNPRATQCLNDARRFVEVYAKPAAEPELPLPPCGLVRMSGEGGGK